MSVNHSSTSIMSPVPFALRPCLAVLSALIILAVWLATAAITLPMLPAIHAPILSAVLFAVTLLIV